MVSFFGRKSKGEKHAAKVEGRDGSAVDKRVLPEGKKTLTKQPKLKDLQRWELENERLYGPGASPFADSSRPSTATSTRSMSNWRSMFKSPAMTSSMVNLAPPQPVGGAALRHHASDTNLRPGSSQQVAARTTGPRPGSFSRPFSSRNSNWVNPLDVHYGKDLGSPSSPPRRPTTSAGPKVAASGSSGVLGQPDAGPPAAAGRPPRPESPKADSQTTRRSDERAFEHGYPSPPQSDLSDKNSTRAFSPVNNPSVDSSSSKGNIPSTLRNLDTAAAKASLPSPAPSLQRVSDEKPEGPVIRNVRARRDTFAFHQPRRQSFTMEFEEGQRLTCMASPQEGFIGNFAEFDFGEAVAKTTSNDGPSLPSLAPGLSKAEPRDMPRSPGSCGQAPSPMEDKASFASWSMSREFETLAREGSVKSLAPSRSSEELAGALIDQLPRPPTDLPGRTGRPRGAAAVHSGEAEGAEGASLKQNPPLGFQSRFDPGKGTRAPPPRPLRPVIPAAVVGGGAGAGHAQTAPLSPASPWDAEVRDIAAAPASSPFTRPPLAGGFPSVKGLPRGRQLQPSAMSSPKEKDSGSSFSSWLGIDRSEPRRSAMPAPLAPLRSHTVTVTAGEPASQSATKSKAPRIPSQMFAPLQASLSDLDEFGKSFDVDFDTRAESPVMGTMSAPRRPQAAGGSSAKRVEAKKAPPRPAPITLPPSAGSGAISPALVSPAMLSPALRSPALRSPADMKFPGNFI